MGTFWQVPTTSNVFFEGSDLVLKFKLDVDLGRGLGSLSGLAV